MIKRGGSKACQSRLREHLQNWSKCVTSWFTDDEAISTLLGNLKQYLDTKSSIKKTLNPTGVDCQNLQGSGLLDFPDLQARLLARITAEMETTLNLIKSYQKGLGDVFIAMQFAANDAYQVLRRNEIEDVAEVAQILLETVIDVQDLQCSFEAQHGCKMALLEELLQLGPHASSTDDSSHNSPYAGQQPGKTLDESHVHRCLDAWGARGAGFSAAQQMLIGSIVEANSSHSSDGV